MAQSTVAGNDACVRGGVVAAAQRFVRPIRLLAAIPLVVVLGVASPAWPDADDPSADAADDAVPLANAANHESGPAVLASVVSANPRLFLDVDEAVLRGVYDAAARPMVVKRGTVTRVDGSRAATVVVGTSAGVFLQGPGAPAAEGRHVYVCRLQIVERGGWRDPMIDLFDGEQRLVQRTIKADAVPEGQWIELTIPVHLRRDSESLSLRIWPHGHTVAADRAYHFELRTPKPRAAVAVAQPQGDESVEAAMVRALRSLLKAYPSDEPALVDIAGMTIVPWNPPEGRPLPDVLEASVTYTWEGKQPATSERNATADATVFRGGLVLLVVDRTYPGRSGSWNDEALTNEQLVEEGWTLIGAWPWKEQSFVFWRVLNGDRRFKIRTTKYWPPQIIIPGSVD